VADDQLDADLRLPRTRIGEGPDIEALTMDASEVLEVLDALDDVGITAGITGGWGVDALLERETRPHRDLDLGIPAARVVEAIDVLRALGYVVAIDERPARIALSGPRGAVDLHPIEFDDAGHGVQQGFEGRRFDYPNGSLAAEGWIAGRQVQVATPELQVTFHSGYPPRERDIQDMLALAEAFHLQLPAAYRKPPG